MIPFITVDYDEESTEKDLGYRGVVLFFDDKEVKRANSGDFVDDYNEITSYALEEYKDFPIMGSSSIEHYITDANLDIEWE